MGYAKIRSEQAEEDFLLASEADDTTFAASAGVSAGSWTWIDNTETTLQGTLDDIDTKASLRVGPAYAAQGDIKYMGASAPVNLSIGTNTEFLGTNGTTPSWTSINDLTADASPVGGTDYLMSYDASAGIHKKVLISDLGYAELGTAQNWTAEQTFQAGAEIGTHANRMVLLAETPSSTNPLLAFLGEEDTGIGRGGADTVSIITQGTEVVAFVGGGANSYADFRAGLFITESSAADPDFAGKGQIWVRNQTPNELYFTDDAGTDWQISGAALLDGTNEWLAKQTFSFDIELKNGATNTWLFDATGTALAIEPQVADGNVNFRNLANATIMQIQLGSSAVQVNGLLTVDTDDFRVGTETGRARIVDEAPSTTNPTYATQGDEDTGWSRSATNQISLIAGATETQRLTTTYNMMQLPLMIKEQAAAIADIADYGQLWVKNDIPNTLMFTDDAGNDHDLTAGGGGAFTADAATQITPSTSIQLDETTGDEIALDLSHAVNKATSGDTAGLYMRVTDTTSPGTIRFLDLGVGGTQQFAVIEGGGIKTVGDIEFLERADHLSTPAAGGGIVWVKNTAPSTLIFTNDDGNDYTLTGTPTTTQGDIIVRGGTEDDRVAIGTKYQALQVNSSADTLEYTDHPEASVTGYYHIPLSGGRGASDSSSSTDPATPEDPGSKNTNGNMIKWRVTGAAESATKQAVAVDWVIPKGYNSAVHNLNFDVAARIVEDVSGAGSVACAIDVEAFELGSSTELVAGSAQTITTSIAWYSFDSVSDGGLVPGDLVTIWLTGSGTDGSLGNGFLLDILGLRAEVVLV